MGVLIRVQLMQAQVFDGEEMQFAAAGEANWLLK